MERRELGCVPKRCSSLQSVVMEKRKNVSRKSLRKKCFTYYPSERQLKDNFSPNRLLNKNKSLILWDKIAVMTKRDTDIAYFLSFCIEQYKKYIGTSGNDVMSLFEQYGVDRYLTDNFEILHTQSKQWLMEEIDEYIKRAKEECL